MKIKHLLCIILLGVMCAFSSCYYKHEARLLSDNSKVIAIEDEVDVVKGDTVVIGKIDEDKWRIMDGSEMKDTTFYNMRTTTYMRADKQLTDTIYTLYKYRIAVVNN